MVKISVIFYTYRAGGFDILIDCLKKQTYQDFELIVIDDYKKRDMSNKIKEAGINLAWYGKQKSKTFPDTPFGFCNIMNTGILHSTGEICVFLQDYQWIMRESFDRFVRLMAMHHCPISAVGKEMEYTGDFKISSELCDYSVFEPEFDGDFGRWVYLKDWIPKEFEFFYWACERSFLEKINGLDERADYHPNACLFLFLEQCRLNRQKYACDKGNVSFITNHRIWSIFNDKMWEVTKTAKPNDEEINKIVPVAVNTHNNFDITGGKY